MHVMCVCVCVCTINNIYDLPLYVHAVYYIQINEKKFGGASPGFIVLGICLHVYIYVHDIIIS